MATARDIRLTDDGDLFIDGGDLVATDSDGQHAEHILMCTPGSFRQWPLVGLGLRRLVNTKLSELDRLTMRKQMRLQLQADGYRVIRADIGINKTLAIHVERI